jgi:3-oxoacyl-(acyl-carrier-protein) synthase
MTPRRVCVTGLGAVSGFGRGAERLWRALVDGARATAERPELAAAGLRVGPVALVPPSRDGEPPAHDAALPARHTGPLPARDARAASFAVEAAREAIADAGALDGVQRLGVVCGTTLGGIERFLTAVRTPVASFAGATGFGYAAPARAVADALAARGPVDTVSVACASGNVALGTALEWIRDGACDAVVAGGADALNEFVLSGFAALKAIDPSPCRPFDRARRGLNLGEGACFLVLESESHALARGARIRAFLDGYGLAADAVHMTGPDREGRGAARAMRLALDDAGAADGDVDFVSAHGTATTFNDLMESKALAAVFGERAPSLPVNSIKSAVGHTLGAAGALEALLCVRSLEEGLVTPTPGHSDPDPALALDVVHGRARPLPLACVLSTSSGFGGSNAALLFRRA